jgi:hypothetical protein
MVMSMGEVVEELEMASGKIFTNVHESKGEARIYEL